eukprot:TRINITY_DN17725_c0_g1_i1.p1 TRINITY_DN17725_c0_g1~~TRINITY_DN17725_c0_g1_i1.p1  ORF type:complete len:248 (+),score=74.55 TRINITY_DN17725_c0_g1_i1:64-807(+)
MSSGFQKGGGGKGGGGGGGGGFNKGGGGGGGSASGFQGKGSRASFTTDFSKMGSGTGATKLFNAGSGGPANVVDQERAMIDKVFQIVDMDNSGTIDMKELEAMFKLFGVESPIVTNTVEKIMNRIDRNHDRNISSQEFYELLSSKFEKGDPKKEIESVFHKMNKSGTGALTAEEMYDVAQRLGENVDRKEIKGMIKMFNLDYQRKLKESQTKKGATLPAPEEPTTLSMNDFYEIMQIDLTASAAPQG